MQPDRNGRGRIRGHLLPRLQSRAPTEQQEDERIQATIPNQTFLHLKYSNHPPDSFRLQHLLLHPDSRKKIPRQLHCQLTWKVVRL